MGVELRAAEADQQARHGTTEAKKVKRVRGRKRSPSLPQWNDDGAMEDGGLVIVDERGALLHVAPGPVATSLRYLIARLQQGPDGEIARRIAFGSALSGEGVTFIARSFSAVLAHDLRRRVCLVDLNWWAQDPSADGDQAGLPGIFDVLYRDTQLADVLVSTQSPDLWLLPAGRAPLSIRPALARHQELALLLGELEQHFDHLVLDLPAVLVTSDAVALAALADEFALVVRQGVATRGELREALDEMHRVSTLGVVLNNTRSTIPRSVRRLLGI